MKKKYAFNRHETRRSGHAPSYFAVEFQWNMNIHLVMQTTIPSFEDVVLVCNSVRIFFVQSVHERLLTRSSFNTYKNWLFCFGFVSIYFFCVSFQIFQFVSWKVVLTSPKHQIRISTIFELHNLNFKECKKSDCLWDFDQNFIGFFFSPLNLVHWIYNLVGKSLCHWSIPMACKKAQINVIVWLIQCF